jgi:hypothetical protein
MIGLASSALASLFLPSFARMVFGGELALGAMRCDVLFESELVREAIGWCIRLARSPQHHKRSPSGSCNACGVSGVEAQARRAD